MLFNLAAGAPVLTGIAVTTPPDKTRYAYLSAFDPAGMVVTATLSDGSTKVVTGYTCAPQIVTAAGGITITYTENGVTKTAVQAVTMYCLLTGISVTAAPAQTFYAYGAAFDPAGMEVIAAMNDGSTKAVTNYTYSPAAVMGDSVTISYTENGVLMTADVAVSYYTYSGNAAFTPGADWSLSLKTAGTLVLSRGASVDVFLVGGGAGAKGGGYGGAGGGRTAAYRGVSIAAGASNAIMIGAGGSGEANGGTTSALGKSAAGGNTSVNNGYVYNRAGGAGGSGGGGYGYSTHDGGAGGSNGSAGAASRAAGGTGQGGTTRAFGETSGALYAGGGGGASYGTKTAGAGGAGGGGTGGHATDGGQTGGTVNTGGGGGAGSADTAGGASIVIIRNAR